MRREIGNHLKTIAAEKYSEELRFNKTFTREKKRGDIAKKLFFPYFQFCRWYHQIWDHLK